jgi:hypothetical protein
MIRRTESGIMRDKVTTNDVVMRTGITYRRLDTWARLGYLDVPVIGQGRAAGRDWPDDQIIAAILINKMSDAGVQPIKGHKVAQLIVKNPSDKTKRSARIGNGVWVTVDTEGIDP